MGNHSIPRSVKCTYSATKVLLFPRLWALLERGRFVSARGPRLHQGHGSVTTAVSNTAVSPGCEKAAEMPRTSAAKMMRSMACINPSDTPGQTESESWRQWAFCHPLELFRGLQNKDGPISTLTMSQRKICNMVEPTKSPSASKQN